ncbi:MAG: isochorismatase family protein [Chloroflexi bacterium]|nr:isochorismatase family protein [Chloroflexota bacterium]
MPNLELRTRFLIHEPRTIELPYREEHFGFKHASVSIPPSQAAIVLVDCWDEPTIESHGERSAQICRDLIRPLLDACRGLGIAVVHAPSPPVARKFPQWLRYAGDSELNPPPKAVSDWPPPDFALRQGAWANLEAHYGEEWLPLRRQHDEIRSIDRAVWPADEDFVIATGDQLHRLCRDGRIRYLFYAGFAANYCVPHRDYGVFAMRERGYCIIMLRDCTTSIGAPGLPHNLCTEEVFHHLESRSLAGSITAKEFAAAAESVMAATKAD